MSAKRIILVLSIILLLYLKLNSQETATVTDIDGNVYQTVKIGGQWWMAENLRVTRYRNGDAIPTGLDVHAWQLTRSGAYAVYPHDDVDGINSDAEMLEAYGALYNWYAVDDLRGLCLEGWQVPSDSDWITLANSLVRWNVAGGKMKSTRTKPDPHPRWDSPNIDATNESGFSGLPGGTRGGLGTYHGIGRSGVWWSSTETDPDNIRTRFMQNRTGNLSMSFNQRLDGPSVRCLRDDE